MKQIKTSRLAIPHFFIGPNKASLAAAAFLEASLDIEAIVVEVGA